MVGNKTDSASPRRADRDMGRLVHDVAQAAQRGSLSDISDIFRQVITSHSGTGRNAGFRAAFETSLRNLSSTNISSSGQNTGAQSLLTALSESGLLGLLRKDDIGFVLDRIVRGMLRDGDTASAFRTEALSRVLETHLETGTYSLLMRSARTYSGNDALPLALGIFHRGLAVGCRPTTAMLNELIRLCLERGDGARARAVMTEMQKDKLAINGDTIRHLLAHAHTVDHVDAVYRMYRAEAECGRLTSTAGHATMFVSAYVRTGLRKSSTASLGPSRTQDVKKTWDLIADIDEDLSFIEKSFAVIDWFFDRGVGALHGAFEALILGCANTGNAEGALRAWREMRRAWLGGPSRRARRALAKSVLLSDVPERLEQVLEPKLFCYAGNREREQIDRLMMRYDNTFDEDVLDFTQTPNGKLARDQAIVLIRWMRTGRATEVMNWIEEWIARHGAIDSRVVAALIVPIQNPKSGKHQAGNELGAVSQDGVSFLMNRIADGHCFIGTDHGGRNIPAARASLGDRILRALEGCGVGIDARLRRTVAESVARLPLHPDETSLNDSEFA